MQGRMRAPITTCVILAGLWTTAALMATPTQSAPADFDHRKLAEIARSKFIVPKYENLRAGIQSLQAAISTLCQAPGKQQLAFARKSYRDAVASWGPVEFIRFGPVAKQNRLERLFYWPDRKGRGRRQVLRLLSAKDKSALDPGQLAVKSVAVQGLTALELILFSKASDQLASKGTDSFACSYAMAIASNLGNIVAEILKEWTPGGEFELIWSSPGTQNPAYLSPSEVSLELVKTLDHGLENLRDRRIAPILGFGKNRRRKSRPVLWRSKSSMILINANIEGLYELLFDGGLADAYVASKPYKGERAEDLMASIKSEFELMIGMSRQLASEADPFSDADIAGRLVPIGFPLRNIRHNAVTELKSAAGLAIGFNASDGD